MTDACVCETLTLSQRSPRRAGPERGSWVERDYERRFPIGAVLITAGAQYLLKIQLGIITPRVNLWLRLYTNDHTPAENDNILDYAQCALAGYAAVELIPDSWVVFPSLPQAAYSYPTVTFNLDAYSGPEVSVFGWYITDPSATVPVCASYLSPPFPVQLSGTSFPVQLIWNDHGEM